MNAQPINRLDAICHPFRNSRSWASRVLLFVGALLRGPVGKTVNQPGDNANSALSFTERTEDPLESVPRFETRTERVQDGDSFPAFSRQMLEAQMLHSLTQAESEQARISQLKVGQSVEFRYRTDNTLAEIAVIHSLIKLLRLRVVMAGQFAKTSRGRNLYRARSSND